MPGEDDTGVGYEAAQQSKGPTEQRSASGACRRSSTSLKRPTDQDYTVEATVTEPGKPRGARPGTLFATRGTFRIQVEPVSYAVRARIPPSLT